MQASLIADRNETLCHPPLLEVSTTDMGMLRSRLHAMCFEPRGMWCKGGDESTIAGAPSWLTEILSGDETFKIMKGVRVDDKTRCSTISSR